RGGGVIVKVALPDLTNSNLREALFSPRSVAIVGQSDDASKAAGRPLKFLRRIGYAGRVYPTGVAEAGAVVFCADAADMPVAARIAPTHTLRMRTLVMTFPPCPKQDSTGFCLNCCVATVPSGFFERRATASSRNDADAAGERFGHRELAVYDLK